MSSVSYFLTVYSSPEGQSYSMAGRKTERKDWTSLPPGSLDPLSPASSPSLFPTFCTSQRVRSPHVPMSALNTSSISFGFHCLAVSRSLAHRQQASLAHLSPLALWQSLQPLQNTLMHLQFSLLKDTEVSGAREKTGNLRAWAAQYPCGMLCSLMPPLLDPGALCGWLYP